MKKRYIIFVLLLMILGIAYSYLTSSFNINGTATIDKVGWDVRITEVDDFLVQSKITKVTNDEVEFNVTLEKPGDQYKIDLYVGNNGDIDAMLKDIEVTQLTSEQKKFLEIEIENGFNCMTYFKNGDLLLKNEKLGINDELNFTIYITFKNDIEASDLPTTQENINLNFKFNFVQADNTAVTRDNICIEQ